MGFDGIEYGMQEAGEDYFLVVGVVEAAGDEGALVGHALDHEFFELSADAEAEFIEVVGEGGAADAVAVDGVMVCLLEGQKVAFGEGRCRTGR